MFDGATRKEIAIRYAFNTWVYSSFPVWLPAYPLEEVIRRLAVIGYDGIEIGCAAPHAYPAYLSRSQRRELRQLLHDVNLVPVSLLPAPGGAAGNNPASANKKEREATVGHYKDVVDLAADLGAGLVVYVAGWRIYGVDRNDAWSWSLESLREIAKHALDKGITIAIEPTSADSNLIDSADDALNLMKQVGEPNVKVMFDTFHALYRNEVSTDYIRQMGDSLAHIHVSEHDRLPPGPGVVDWLSVLRALKEVDYRGYVTMEIGFNTRAVDPDSFARRALQYLKGIEAQLEPELPVKDSLKMQKDAKGARRQK